MTTTSDSSHHDVIKENQQQSRRKDLSNLPGTAKLGDLTLNVDQIRDDEVSELFDVSRQSTSAGIKQVDAPDTLNEMKTFLRDGIAFILRILPEKKTVNNSKEHENNSQIIPDVSRNNDTYEIMGGIMIRKSDLARSYHFDNISNILFIGTDKLYHGERLQDAVKLAEKLIGDISLGYPAMTCLVYRGNRETVFSLKSAGMEITATFPNVDPAKTDGDSIYLMFKYIHGYNQGQVSEILGYIFMY